MTKSQATQAFTAIGIDVGKDVFHIVGFDGAGAIALRKKIRRSAFVQPLVMLRPLRRGFAENRLSGLM